MSHLSLVQEAGDVKLVGNHWLGIFHVIILDLGLLRLNGVAKPKNSYACRSLGYETNLQKVSGW